MDSELSSLSKNHTHTPWLSGVQIEKYPSPLVDEKTARSKAKKFILLDNQRAFFDMAKKYLSGTWQ